MPESVDATRLKLTNQDGTEGVLVGTRCRDCSAYSFGPATFCQRCTADSLETVELSKQGTLYSYTVVRIPPQGWPGPVPYFLGQIELPEGPHVLAEVVDCEENELKIGTAVELALFAVKSEESDEDKVVYKWRPMSSHSEQGG